MPIPHKRSTSVLFCWHRLIVEKYAKWPSASNQTYCPPYRPSFFRRVAPDMPTIAPLTPEAAWLPTLLALVDWDLPLVPTIVLAPHPDDETLGAGGLVAKLCRAAVPVTIVAITDGEHAYADTPNLGEIRVLEQTEALHRLGVPRSMIHRLHLPDRDISRYEKRARGPALTLCYCGHAPCRAMAAGLSS